MKRPSTYHDHRSRLEVKMTPMIDVVFLLLVFFVWTASFDVVEHVLPSQLSPLVGTSPPESPDVPPPEADFDDVVVRLINQGGQVAWTINEAPMANLDDLKQQLDQIARIKRDAPVILHPDGNVALGDVIDVYDISRQVGFEKVQFAAEGA